MLRSVLKCPLKNNESTRPFYLLLRDRIEFIQKLNHTVPDSPKLRQGVLKALSIDTIGTLVDEFVRHEVHEPTATEVCGDGEACRWAIIDLTDQLQKALCSFLLRCIMYSQAVDDSPISPTVPNSLMEKLTRISVARHECPFENNLKTRTSSHDFLSFIEEFASPEARISSHNWRQSLMDRLAREAGRQHGFIVSAVGEVCRDLEGRCETVEEPLRAEKENSRRLQNELNEWKTKYTDANEQLTKNLHNLHRTSAENEKLEAKLDGAISKTKETLSRVKELEAVLEREREASRHAIQDLERTVEQAKSEHLEELKDIENNAERAALENMAALNERQEMIDELQEHRRGLEQDIDDANEEIRALKDEQGRLEETAQSFGNLVSELQHDLNESREQVKSLKEDLQEKSEQIERLKEKEIAMSDDNNRLQENLAIMTQRLEAVEKALYERRTTLVRKLLYIERQDQLIDELAYETRLQKHQMALSQKLHGELRENVRRVQDELQKAIQDGIQERTKLHSEVSTKYELQVCRTEVSWLPCPDTDSTNRLPTSKANTMKSLIRSASTTKPKSTASRTSFSASKMNSSKQTMTGKKNTILNSTRSTPSMQNSTNSEPSTRSVKTKRRAWDANFSASCRAQNRTLRDSSAEIRHRWIRSQIRPRLRVERLFLPAASPVRAMAITVTTTTISVPKPYTTIHLQPTAGNLDFQIHHTAGRRLPYGPTTWCLPRKSTIWR